MWTVGENACFLAKRHFNLYWELPLNKDILKLRENKPSEVSFSEDFQLINFLKHTVLSDSFLVCRLIAHCIDCTCPFVELMLHRPEDVLKKKKRNWHHRVGKTGFPIIISNEKVNRFRSSAYNQLKEWKMRATS